MATFLKYTAKVHSTNRQLVNVPAIVDGQQTVAMIDGLQVQLVPTNPQQGSLSCAFYGADLTPAMEIFQKDAEVVVTFSTPVPDAGGGGQLPG